MIARAWHGIVPRASARDYGKYLEKTGITDLEATPGNMGVHVLQRHHDDVTHFWLISYWESADHIRAFAGSDIDVARYYPDDADFLIELEPTVTHYDVIYDSQRPSP